MMADVEGFYVLCPPRSAKYSPFMINVVFRREFGLLAPRMPFCQRSSSSSKVIGSAFFVVVPIPADWSLFISESRTTRNCANSLSLKMSIAGLPLHLRNLIIPQAKCWERTFCHLSSVLPRRNDTSSSVSGPQSYPSGEVVVFPLQQHVVQPVTPTF